MRALMLPAAALALSAAIVLAGGRLVEAPIVIDEPDAEAIAATEEAVASTRAAEPAAQAALPASPAREPAAAQTSQSAPKPAMPSAQAPDTESAPPVAAAGAAKDTARSRLVAPAVVAPPELASEGLEREAPREPLSKLSLALPPPPEPKNDWAGKPFLRPLAIESAVFQSMDRTIAIAGVKSVPLDESCDFEGESWPCGVRARAAFRMWLRGRALVCQLPVEEQAVTPARCRLAKQDAGAWLVANGWALADPDGPYVQAEEKARKEKMGIFGAPPDATSLSEVPDAPSSGLPEAVMTEGGVDPQPSLGPELVFPPAPPLP